MDPETLTRTYNGRAYPTPTQHDATILYVSYEYHSRAAARPHSTTDKTVPGTWHAFGRYVWAPKNVKTAGRTTATLRYAGRDGRAVR